MTRNVFAFLLMFSTYLSVNVAAHNKRRIDFNERRLIFEDVARHIRENNEILLGNLSRKSAARHADVEQTRDHAVDVERHRCCC